MIKININFLFKILHFILKYRCDITLFIVFLRHQIPRIGAIMNKNKNTELIKAKGNNIDLYRKHIALLIADIDDELLLKKIFQFIHDKYVKS